MINKKKQVSAIVSMKYTPTTRLRLTLQARLAENLMQSVVRPRSQAVSRVLVQELQEVEIPTGHLVGRGPEEDQEAERAGPDIRALC